MKGKSRLTAEDTPPPEKKKTSNTFHQITNGEDLNYTEIQWQKSAKESHHADFTLDDSRFYKIRHPVKK